MSDKINELPPTVLVAGLEFPEGPAFDRQGRLWAVELHGGNLVCLADGQLRRIPVGGEPNGIAIDAADRIVFCDAGHCGIRRYDPAKDSTQTLADSLDGQPLDKPNDLAYDAAGNLLFTCPGNSRQDPTGYVCMLSPAGEVSLVADKLYFPNGLAFTADGRRLVIAETYRQRLWLGAWEAGEWREPRVLAEVGGAPGPDGMAFAADGDLYVAVFGSGQVKVVAPDGSLAAVYPVPGSRPTNCAFDPAGRLGLVVTEAERGELLSLPVSVGGQTLFQPEESS